MPKTADQDQRRGQIVEGLVRLAAREGLHAVTMRAVAAEAGVSLRLVQYYFESKAGLMMAALEHLERQSHARWAARLAGLPDPPPARALLDAFFAEALPTDAESRAFHLLWTSYALLAITDRELAGEPFTDGPNRLERQLAAALRRARAGAELSGALDADAEAATLVNLGHGLGASVLSGRYTPDQALAIARYHLDRLFRA